MLFVALLKPIAGTPKERIARRLQWQYPKGLRLVAEYWLQRSDPMVISITEAEVVAPIMAALTEWGDFFDITVVPAITAEEGIELAKKMIQGERGISNLADWRPFWARIAHSRGS